MIMTTITKRVDKLMKDLQEVKTRLEFTEKEVDVLKDKRSKLNNGFSSNSNDIQKFAESMLVLDSNWTVWRITVNKIIF